MTEGATVPLSPKFLRLVGTPLSYASAADDHPADRGRGIHVDRSGLIDAALIIGHSTDTTTRIWVRGIVKAGLQGGLPRCR